jgi:predicted hydrocarbon binding protein
LNTTPTPRRIENSIMWLALRATEGTLGQSGLYAMLRLAGLDQYIEQPPRNDNELTTPGTDLSALLAAILHMYGEHSTRGLFRRWGLLFGQGGVESRPAARVLRPILNFLPPDRRVLTLLETFVREADQARGEALHTFCETDTTFEIVFNDCLACHSLRALRTSEPICLTLVGTLEAVLKWGTGRDYAVSETTCAACGAEACTFVIDKRPLNV